MTFLTEFKRLQICPFLNYKTKNMTYMFMPWVAFDKAKFNIAPGLHAKSDIFQFKHVNV